MKVYCNPEKEKLDKILCRPFENDRNAEKCVREIIKNVRKRGDAALYEYAQIFDSSSLDSLFVSEEEIERSENALDDALKSAIETAASNIRKFHESQRMSEKKVSTMDGVKLWRISRPIESVGLYVPGGSAPLFSTVLMLAIPAQIAKCKDIMIATPAKNGKVNDAVLFAAKISGARKILKVGGAQAIAAFAYGTESIKKRDKIFGPGNRYVNIAKKMVSEDVCIDMFAGPSEVMVVIDRFSSARYAALDLLSQAEHGEDSQVVLLIREDEKNGRKVLSSVMKELEKEIDTLDRRKIIEKSLSSSVAIISEDENLIIDAINEYAPEHLILNTRNHMDMLERVNNAGSIFLGPYSSESCGDYASGVNHSLPTSAQAKFTGGVSLDSFIKKITVEKISRKGARELASSVMTMALSEGLDAHKRAMEVRLD